MDKNELKAKYGRIANDPSQLEMFKDDVIDGKVSPLPETPVDPEDKTYTLRFEDGEIKWSEGGSGPTPILGEKTITENATYIAADDGFDGYSSVKVEVPTGPAPEPVAKGSIIKLAGEEYRVLSVNEDLTDCEVMSLGPVTSSKFANASPTQDPSAGTTFIVDGVEKTGLKYEGSLLDQACEAFYDALPADVKVAIIEQEVEQDMYNTNATKGTEDFAIDNSAEGGLVYRFKKVNDAPVTVGTRHAYVVSCGAIKEYFGGTSARGINVLKIFQLSSWLKDAEFTNSSYACCFISSVQQGNYASSYFICPAFHIDLTKVNL